MIDVTKFNLQKFGINIVSEENDFLIIRGFNNQKFWKIRKQLPDKLTAESIGFWFGDGDKVNSLGVTNTEISLVSKFLEFTEEIGISREHFKLEVTAKNEENVNKAELSRFFKINEDKIKVRTSQLAKNTSFRVRMFSRVITRLFHAITEFISESDDTQLKSDFLRGVISAEGCISLRADKKTHQVFISLKDDSEKEWLKTRFIHPLSIKTSKNNEDSIVIGNKENFKRLIELQLMTLHKEKSKKFFDSVLPLLNPHHS